MAPTGFALPGLTPEVIPQVWAGAEFDGRLPHQLLHRLMPCHRNLDGHCDLGWPRRAVHTGQRHITLQYKFSGPPGRQKLSQPVSGSQGHRERRTAP